MIPIEVRYHCAVLRLSVPHQSTVPFAYASWRQVDSATGAEPGVPYFVSFDVHLFSTSGSSALLVGTLSTAIALLIPASASENASERERDWVACCADDVEYMTAVVPAMLSTAMIPIAITRAIPRSDPTTRTRSPSHRCRMA